MYIHTAAANADCLLLHPPLLVWVTAHKLQYSEGAVDWTALTVTLLATFKVVHSIPIAYDMGNVLREPSCIVVTLIL